MEIAQKRVSNQARRMVKDLADDIRDAAQDILSFHFRTGRASDSIFVNVSQSRDVLGRFGSAWEAEVGYDTDIAPHGPPIETGTGIYGPYRRPYIGKLPGGQEFLHPGMRPIGPLDRAFQFTKIPRDVRVRRFSEGIRVID